MIYKRATKIQIISQIWSLSYTLSVFALDQYLLFVFPSQSSQTLHAA